MNKKQENFSSKNYLITKLNKHIPIKLIFLETSVYRNSPDTLKFLQNCNIKSIEFAPFAVTRMNKDIVSAI